VFYCERKKIIVDFFAITLFSENDSRIGVASFTFFTFGRTTH